METLAFKDLSFTYPGAASPALEHIDLTVEAENPPFCGWQSPDLSRWES